MSATQKLISLFSVRERWLVAGLLLMMAGGAALEVIGIGLVVPVVAAAISPDVALADPWFRRAYDFSGARTPERFELMLLAAFLALILLKNAYLALLANLQFRFVYSKQAQISNRLFGGYLRAPYALHLERHSADVTRNLVTEVNSLFTGVVIPLLAVGAESMVLALLIGTLVATMPQASLLVLGLGSALVVGIYMGLRSMLGRYGVERAALSGKRIQAIGDALGGLKEVKVLGRERFFIESFADTNGRFLVASRIFATLNAMPRLLIESLSILLLVGAILAALGVGGNVAAAAPVVVLLCLVALRLMPAATRILVGVASIRFYLPALDQVNDDLHALEALLANDHRRGAGQALLSLQREIAVQAVSFTYPKAPRPALGGVTLSIKAGDISALVGASGAGKSTLADLILGVYEPQHGHILADGVDIQSNLRGWRRGVGYVPQSVHLVDSSVRRNVAFGLPDDEVDDARVWAALKAAQLDSLVRALPGGLDERIGEQGMKLSGGQRQRLGIARALYSEPQVLILDEATSALDIQTERAIADTLLDMRLTRTVIVIAHRLDTIRRCDRLFFLADGRLQAAGSYDELLNSNARFAALVGEATL